MFRQDAVTRFNARQTPVGRQLEDHRQIEPPGRHDDLAESRQHHVAVVNVCGGVVDLAPRLQQPSDAPDLRRPDPLETAVRQHRGEAHADEEHGAQPYGIGDVVTCGCQNFGPGDREDHDPGAVRHDAHGAQDAIALRVRAFEA